MAHLTQLDTSAKGNTNSSPRVDLSMKKSRKWCFTLNNYKGEELDTLDTILKSKDYKYILGREIGEQGTPHIQGYLEGKNPIRFSTLKNINKRLHLEKARGTTKQNLTYCSKDNNYITNFNMNILKDRNEIILEKEYNNVIWKEWQQKILDLIKTEPDKRKINWFYDYDGNIGKSYLYKYISLINKGVIICDGKKDNVFNQINTLITELIEPEIIIMDIPRYNLEFINYGTIEQIKNGFLYSGKYEGNKCIFSIPHIIIFSNQPPDYNKWSKDRYNVIELNE